MFYVFYVLAILCGNAFCLKLHAPASVLANVPTNVTWSREHRKDPDKVFMLIEDIVGGNKTIIDNQVVSLSTSMKHTSAVMNFSNVGTFRLWAVNPDDHSQAYAMSDTFAVTQNNAVPDPSKDSDDSSNFPPPPPPGSAASSSSSPVAASSNAAATSSTRGTSQLPYIIGGAVGGVVFVSLLAGVLYIICRRRRGRVGRRTTFHRNRMVKSLPPLTFVVPKDLEEPDDLPFEKPARRGYRPDVPPPSGAYPFART
ncbi:hypothetical protein B0H10DRAFT_378563 [Mycena sp. CBHHK59/15]|nr:hypothetical protein B0H10DRAFT_378563 [Mycena sp. CBHHK59/15]